MDMSALPQFFRSETKSMSKNISLSNGPKVCRDLPGTGNSPAVYT